MAKRIYIHYEGLRTYIENIHSALGPIIEQVTKIADSAEIPLPLRLRGEPLSTGQAVHAALIKMKRDIDGKAIKHDDWMQCIMAYDTIVAQYGNKGGSTPDNQYVYFTEDMLDLVTTIGEYVEEQALPTPQIRYKTGISPKVIASLAVIHAGKEKG